MQNVVLNNGVEMPILGLGKLLRDRRLGCRCTDRIAVRRY